LGILAIYFTYQPLINKTMSVISKKLKLMFQIAKTDAMLSRKFSSQGLGFGDLAVLYAISTANGGKIRRIDLAEKVGLTASGVTRILIPLEKIGVVKREANARDARVSYAMLTQSGKTLLHESLESAEVVCDDLIPNDKEKQLDGLHELLASIG
jgi:DNA-binding MarR family transcriptional regulator